ncbi:MAG: phage tail assembly protein [Deltaproteobacteria bacterium]|jgi:hypothetical protein|nr:phage tail assembly protein [Deltaproteobacteria bacterium]
MKSIHFSSPLKIGGAARATLDMRDPCMGDEEDALSMAQDMGRGENALTVEMCLLSRLCGLRYEETRSMRSADYKRLREAYAALAGDGGAKNAEPEAEEAPPPAA